MIKFTTQLLKFTISLVFIVIILLIIAAKSHQFQPTPKYYSEEFEQAYQAKDADIVAIGNSKLLSALDKRILEENEKLNVAILGYSSANISVSKLTLESYLNNCSTTPNIVLLEVSWFTFNNQRTHLHGLVGDLFVKDYRLWKNYFNYNSDLILPKIKKSFKRSLNSSIGFNPVKKKTSYEDWFKESSPQTVDYKFDTTKFEVLFPDHVAGIDKLLLRDYNSIIDLCNNNGIVLILFTAPEDENFSKCQKDNKEIKTIYQKSSNDYSNIYYLDYTFGGEFYDKKYEKWLANSHHINENKLFSIELVKDIKEQIHNTEYNE